jgi:hypothetical protein
MTFRFQKIHELGSKGKRSNPLLLEEFQWENEWVDINYDPVHASNDMTWKHVDEAVGATDELRGRNMPREAAARARNTVARTYGRERNKKRKTRSESSAHEEEEEEEDRVAPEEVHGASGAETDEEMEDQGGEEDLGGPATNARNEEFHVDADLLL